MDKEITMEDFWGLFYKKVINADMPMFTAIIEHPPPIGSIIKVHGRKYILLQKSVDCLNRTRCTYSRIFTPKE